MPLYIAYAPHALSFLAVAAYALRRIPMIVMWGILAFAFAWCTGRDISLQHSVMTGVDAGFAITCAIAVIVCVFYDETGERR